MLAFGIVTAVTAFVIFLLYRCCYSSRDKKKSASTVSSKWTQEANLETNITAKRPKSKPKKNKTSGSSTDDPDSSESSDSTYNDEDDAKLQKLQEEKEKARLLKNGFEGFENVKKVEKIPAGMKKGKPKKRRNT